jgi:hypothetical protein
MAESFLLYLACGLACLGLVSLLVPLRSLGVRNRWVALGAAVAGLAAALVVLSWPARQTTVAARTTALDDFAPSYQFVEHHKIPIRAGAFQVYSALKSVSADEIPFYRALTWVRRGGNVGPESILNPPDGVPLVAVATRTSFITLADTPGREYVMGTVVIAPPGVRLALGSGPESFTSLTQPGFAKATIGFRIEPRPDGWTLLRTETRVDATDYVSRATFARYWRVIAPGSAFVRLMWLRAVKVRAESLATAPAVARADWSWFERLGRERRPPVEEPPPPVRLRR